MKRRGKYLGVKVVLLLLLLLGSLPSEAAELEHEIKLATLAPENSSLMKIFREMDSEVRKETEGRVGFKLFSGFALGNERDIFRKLRFGLIHGATFSAHFLADINPDIRALQVPFLFNNYQEVDHVQVTMDTLEVVQVDRLEFLHIVGISLLCQGVGFVIFFGPL